eukprot:CAMPEP_0205921572 /NCGR_PEP_ID=MMETSP1325-20131115/13069_1 /ASSEMBLY_ACC=CAM_ASM_000708 /TAXON_ID=236786 /ORGANISM="Florenciella sp., Strain RCC1007" /LENGTH=68 /DNA_ID=CAMNT_0053289421 /DNA_START=35 /DNA_END=241 /DNA_ORIENTATION=+
MKFILVALAVLSPAVAFNQAMPKATRGVPAAPAVVIPTAEFEIDPLDNPDIKPDDSITQARKCGFCMG